MERTSSWFISFVIVLFWVFRLIVALLTQSGDTLAGFIAFDFNIEIILLFITVFSFFLIVKRKMLGAIIYLLTYGYYFGGYIYTNVLPELSNGNEFDIILIQNAIISLVAVFISIFALIDIMIDKKVKSKYKDKKTDWFFNEESTDRKVDERADKNQYKLY